MTSLTICIMYIKPWEIKKLKKEVTVKTRNYEVEFIQ